MEIQALVLSRTNYTTTMIPFFLGISTCASDIHSQGLENQRHLDHYLSGFQGLLIAETWMYRSCFSPRECHQVLQMTQDSKSTNETYYQFEGGVQLGIGAFNLMLSLLPGRILRLLEFIGFSGNRELGLQQLREGASGASLRAILCSFTLLLYHTYVSLILGTGESNLLEAEALLQPYLQKFPKGALILFYDARIDILKGNFEKAQVTFQECIAAQQEWKQIHHLCYWELMWCYSFQQNWLQAYQYADLLCKESRWSKAIYMFQKAAILCMLPDDDVKTTGENIVALFRQVEGLKQRIAGKSIPTEKFAVRKARRYAGSQPVKLVVPALVFTAQLLILIN
ncbi:UNVERIFIED_CONTAM: Tetratricopeptide repeat protein 39B [Gekko kuhli]